MRSFLLIMMMCVSGAPASQPEPPMPRWFAQLADADAQVRAEAHRNLLGMKRSELTAFREVVAKARPLHASQRVALREIVSHVYLSGEPYRAAESQGFMGVILGVELVPLQAGGTDKEKDTEHKGIMVVERLVGFCGYSALADGDVILSIVERPNLAFRKRGDLVAAVAATPPHSVIHFEVIRQGQIVRVPMTVDARPRAVEDPLLAESFMKARVAKADEYWKQNFMPLLEEGLPKSRLPKECERICDAAILGVGTVTAYPGKVF